MNNVPGIYKITCLANKRIYIGSSVELVTRLQRHRWEMKNNVHHNPILQASYNKHGAESFQYEVIEKCPRDALVEREQYWMDFYKAAERGTGFNVIPKADRSEMAEETKRKISEANKGKPKSPETRERMKQAQQNRSADWCKAISDGKKGSIFSPEHRENLSVAKLGQRVASNLKPCICVETGEYFDCLRDAEIRFDIKRGTLHAALKRGTRCQGKGFRYGDESERRQNAGADKAAA